MARLIRRNADLDQAEKIMIDSKTDYPAACNALETLLLHESLLPDGAQRLLDAARNAGVTLFGGPKAVAQLGEDDARVVVTLRGEGEVRVRIVVYSPGARGHELVTLRQGEADGIWCIFAPLLSMQVSRLPSL